MTLCASKSVLLHKSIGLHAYMYMQSFLPCCLPRISQFDELWHLFKEKQSIVIIACVTDLCLLLHNQSAHTTHTHKVVHLTKDETSWQAADKGCVILTSKRTDKDTHTHTQMVHLTKDETSWQAADKGWVILTSKRTNKDQHTTGQIINLPSSSLSVFHQVENIDTAKKLKPGP